MSGAMPLPPVQSTETIITEPTAVAAPAALTPPSPEQDQQAAARFAALARRERAAYKARQEAKQIHQSFAQQKAEYDRFQESKGRARQNPIEYLNQGGLTYEDLINYQLNGGKPTPDLEIKEVRSEFENYKKQQEEMKAQQVEQQKQQIEAEKAQIENDWTDELYEWVDSVDDYDLITKTNQHEMVKMTIKEHWDQNVKQWLQNGRQGKPPKLMNNKEAADLVLGYLKETIDNVVGTSKHFSGRYKKVEDPQPQATSRSSEPTFKQATTLSNNIPTSAAPSMLPARNESDRIARALAKLSGG